ncbi:hypothetical protein K469DRAFT_642052, partial [Zopfia rhizophila CBS 207.26]
MARTRSKPTPKENDAEPDPTSTKLLPPSVENPPKLFILPKDTSSEARIVTLDNPATAAPSRYLFCPEKGFYEFTRIAAPKKTPRSWLITPDQTPKDGKTQEESSAEQAKEKPVEEQDGVDMSQSYIANSSDLFIATPIDIFFLLLPALSPKSAKETKQHFLCIDDHLDTLSSSPHLKSLLQTPKLREMIERRMEALCDTVDAGDEKMYRLSTQKVLEVLVKKAERMTRNFPKSMEDKFVKPQLEIPVIGIRREESSISISTATATDSQSQCTTTATDFQTSVESTSTVATSNSVVEEEAKPAIETPPEVPHLLRLRTSLTYLLSSYIPPSLSPILTSLLKSPSSVPDFIPLDTHLTALSKLRAEAAALRSIYDNVSRKRGFEEDEEKMAEREEKKRKKEEEDKRKKMESRGVKQLKKVDVSGMKKLSSFFAKAPAK